ncbi:MAG: hypothetical protein WC284_11515 [Candidimonas sp.]
MIKKEKCILFKTNTIIKNLDEVYVIDHVEANYIASIFLKNMNKFLWNSCEYYNDQNKQDNIFEISAERIHMNNELVKISIIYYYFTIQNSIHSGIEQILNIIFSENGNPYAFYFNIPESLKNFPLWDDDEWLLWAISHS